MRKTLRFLMIVVFASLCITNVSAGAVVTGTTFTVSFDEEYQQLFPTLPGVSNGSGSSDGDFTETTTASVGMGVTITVTASESGTKNRIWSSSPRLRLYNGTLTFRGENITKLVFNSNDKFNLSTETGTLTEKTWVGQADEVVFAVGGNTQLKSVEITLGGEVVDPSQLAKVLYTEPFTQNEGQFTIDNKVLPEGLSYVWKFQSSYGATASAFANSTSYETESWLVSPVIDLSKATETTLEFTHALNKFSSIEAAKDQAVVLVKIGNGDWAPLEGVVYPEALGWTYVENNIDVSSLFDGKKVQVAFKYTSTAESAGTWEIKPFTVKGKGEASIEAVEQPATPVASIAALLAGENMTNVEVSLMNSQVLYNDGNYIYVRQANTPICLYQMPQDVKDALKTNAMISGTLRGDYEVYKSMPELKANKYTAATSFTAEVVEGMEAQPVQATLADVATGKHVCDLVTLKAILGKNVTYQEDGVTVKSTSYYLTDDNDIEVAVVNNGKNLNKCEEGDELIVTAIVNTNNGVCQLKLTKNVEDLSGISDVVAGSQKQAPIYNLAGQRVARADKGMFIQNGKKFVK